MYSAWKTIEFTFSSRKWYETIMKELKIEKFQNLQNNTEGTWNKEYWQNELWPAPRNVLKY
jgi:hypothetical protein